MNDLFPVLFVVAFGIAVAFGLVGAGIATPKGCVKAGFLFGFLLGPIGLLIVALALDGRKLCPLCRERVNTEAAICAHCRTTLIWFENEPITPEELMDIAARRPQ